MFILDIFLHIRIHIVGILVLYVCYDVRVYKCWLSVRR